MSTKNYQQTLRNIARDRQMKMLTKKDKDTLLKLAKLMQKANEDVSFRDKLSAHDAAMKGIEKYMNVLKQIPAPKKSKAVQKLAMAVQKMFMKKDESVDSVNERLEWDQHDSKISGEIDKVFRMAKIKVLKHIPYKRSHRSGDSAMYGAFIHTKDKKGNKTVVPIEVDKKGIITYAGGPRGWHPMEKIGALNLSHAKPADFLKIKTYARTMDYLKTFQKLDGWGQDVIYKK